MPKKDKEPIEIYLKEISKYPNLSSEKEKILVGDYYNTKNQEIKEKLIKTNLRFVVCVAKGFQGRGLSLIELIAEGNLGLIEAVERMDPNKGTHVITYAGWWIEQSIKKALKEKVPDIRLPIHQIEERNRVLQTQQDYLEYPINEQIKYISKDLGISEKKVRHWLEISQANPSLDYVGKEEQGNDLEYRMSLRRTFEKQTFENELKENINEILDRKLTEEEKKIFEYKTGINETKRLSSIQIGKEFGKTTNKIEQIYRKTLAILREDPRLKEWYDSEKTV